MLLIVFISGFLAAVAALIAFGVPLGYALSVLLISIFDMEGLDRLLNQVKDCVEGNKCPAKDDARHVALEKLFWRYAKNAGRPAKIALASIFVFVDAITDPEVPREIKAAMTRAFLGKEPGTN